MTNNVKLSERNSVLGDWAKWTAAPYCEFKDDRARLFALISRDVRRFFITIVVTYAGISLPWQGWFALFVG